MPYTHHDENINNYNKVDGSYVLIDIGSTSTPLYKKLSVETNLLRKGCKHFYWGCLCLQMEQPNC